GVRSPTPRPGNVRRQITYKARWAGRQLSVVDRWYPSSKTCSACGAVNKALQLHQRRWTCPACDTEHDRDDNAAINIEREGLRLIDCKAPAALPAESRRAAAPGALQSNTASNTPMSGEINARGDLG
ncbi:Transposase, partial [mine drainage metagenome]